MGDLKSAISRVTSQRNPPKSSVGYLAEEYDGFGAFTIVTLRLGSASAAIAAVPPAVRSGENPISAGTQVRLLSRDGHLEIVSFGNPSFAITDEGLDEDGDVQQQGSPTTIESPTITDSAGSTVVDSGQISGTWHEVVRSRLANSTFELTPSLPDDPVTDDNPIPYWDEMYNTGNISISSTDSSSAEGRVVQFSCPGGRNEAAWIAQKVPYPWGKLGQIDNSRFTVQANFQKVSSDPGAIVQAVLIGDWWDETHQISFPWNSPALVGGPQTLSFQVPSVPPGAKYLRVVLGIWCNTVGYPNPAVIEVAAVSLDDTITTSRIDLRDDHGNVILTPAGFGPAWDDFIAGTLYNSLFKLGVNGEYTFVPSDDTEILPYWEVLWDYGSPTAEVKDASSYYTLPSGFPGGRFLELHLVDTDSLYIRSAWVPAQPGVLFQPVITYELVSGAGTGLTVYFYTEGDDKDHNPVESVGHSDPIAVPASPGYPTSVPIGAAKGLEPRVAFIRSGCIIAGEVGTDAVIRIGSIQLLQVPKQTFILESAGAVASQTLATPGVWDNVGKDGGGTLSVQIDPAYAGQRWLITYQGSGSAGTAAALRWAVYRTNAAAYLALAYGDNATTMPQARGGAKIWVAPDTTSEMFTLRMSASAGTNNVITMSTSEVSNFIQAVPLN